ncbi:TolC family outer membrane protein [Pseudomonas sp. 21LCFQ02]|uniref:TolC family outer membrane protein n=1 Tax=unclassified Pseudomonas TaxID=196821 RepID=UPI00209B1FEC|nr:MULTISPECIES: TolC family outer membrane protein [unclassified Pseudomonas]MCO8168821.1 TolC family outer membrane protein [Pseudomonas sp. 21LCFQ02]MCQ9427023.1 TolC family outer membrane protein [Pseudomonas sp. LJDD11]
MAGLVAQCLTVSLMMLSLPLMAQTSDLLGVYRQALDNDAQYAAAQAQRRAGQERELQGRAGLLPQISFDAQTSWSETEYEVVNGRLEQRRQNRSYGIQLVQPLFRWQNWIEYRQGGLHKALAELRARSAEQALILRVAQAYFEVLHTQDVIAAMLQLQAADLEQLASARKNFELGNANIVDVHEAQMSYDSTRAQLIKARSDLGVARHALARLTGLPAQELSALGEQINLVSPEPGDVETWVRAAEHSSLEVQIQELTTEVAENEVRSRKAEHLPSIDMVLSQNMQQNPNANTQRSESAAIGLRLSLPLYSGGRLTSSAREAVALHQQAQYQLLDTRRAAALATREAWAGVTDGMAQIKALEVARVSAQSAVDSNRLGYRVGVRVGADVLEVQSQLSEIVRQLAKARYDALLAQLQLKAAIGALGEGDLADINAFLQ